MPDAFSLREFDFSGEVKTPDYSRFFQTLDELGVKRGRDLETNLLVQDMSPSEKYFVGDLIWESVRYAQSQPADVRISSAGPSPELVLFSRFLADNCLVLSDCSVQRWQRELGHRVHTVYWTGLLDQMLLCREALLSGSLIICPSFVSRTLRSMEGVDYEIDLSDSLTNVDSTYLGKGPSVTRHENASDARKTPVVVPLMEVAVPTVRNADPWQMAKILEGEGISFRKLRHALSDFRAASGHTVSSSSLNEMSERLDYEVAHLKDDLEALFRQRETALGKAALGMVGVVLAVTLPASLGPIAAGLGAAAVGVNTLDYVGKVRDSRAAARDSDFYLAWKALDWRHGE